MEAGGIEPPSRDVPWRPSTCVVVDLGLVRGDAHDRLPRGPAGEVSPPFRPAAVGGPARRWRPTPPYGRGGRVGLPGIRQPERSWCWQLSVSKQVLTGAAWVPGAPIATASIRSSPFAPEGGTGAGRLGKRGTPRPDPRILPRSRAFDLRPAARRHADPRASQRTRLPPARRRRAAYPRRRPWA